MFVDIDMQAVSIGGRLMSRDDASQGENFVQTVRELAPFIAAPADEIENTRDIPDTLLCRAS